MDKPAAIQQIREVCNNVSRELMRIHPAVPALAEKEAQDEIYKTLFELTKQVEIIKKRLAKLEAKDESTLL
jgi:thymidylate synthase ThyX